MAQKYKETRETRWGEVTDYRKGVTVIHLFNEEWRIGRLNWKKDKEPHVVIYAPDDKQYHCYSEEALEIFDIGSDIEYWNERPETVDRAKAKIWILTHVLDDPDAWCFDMKGQIPFEGLPVKVIYENGTIKWIDSFSGDWENHKMEIPTEICMGENPDWKTWPKTDKEKKEKQFLWKDGFKYKNVVAWRMKGSRPKK